MKYREKLPIKWLRVYVGTGRLTSKLPNYVFLIPIVGHTGANDRARSC